jgi:hypothetical protein
VRVTKDFENYVMITKDLFNLFPEFMHCQLDQYITEYHGRAKVRLKGMGFRPTSIQRRSSLDKVIPEVVQEEGYPTLEFLLQLECVIYKLNVVDLLLCCFY